jgi:hypothetical protein
VLVAVAMGVWVFFAGYLAWYVTLAKCDAPISADEAKVLWEMHKQSSCCGGSRWRSVARKSGKVLGFECECGFRYTQKRLILSGSPKAGD